MDTTKQTQLEQTPKEIEEAQRTMRQNILTRGNPLSKTNAYREKYWKSDGEDFVSRDEWEKTLAEALEKDGPIILTRTFIRYGAKGWDMALEVGEISASMLAKAYQRDGTESSLILSVQKGSTAWLQRCLKFGAEPHWKDHIGRCAAHILGMDEAWKKIMTGTDGTILRLGDDRVYGIHFKRWERFVTTAWKLLVLPDMKNGDNPLDWSKRSPREHLENIQVTDERKATVLDRMILSSVGLDQNKNATRSPTRPRRLV